MAPAQGGPFLVEALVEGSDVDTVEVTVEDTTAPSLDISLAPDQLWPPNHKMVTIAALVVLSDVCDPDPTVELVSISSDEPDNGLGDGDRPHDIQDAEVGTDDRSFSLRSERSGTGDGRIYAITYEATDDSDNLSSAIAEVIVAHSNGKE